MSKIIPESLVRYSPQPMSAYGQSSSLIDTPERWNLAYLSFDFDNKRFHPDPMFSVHVRRTTQMRLDGGGLDLVEGQPGACVGSLLTLMAPRFAYLIARHPILNTLPLFTAYGDYWVNRVESRARTHCVSDNSVPGPELVESLDQAIAVIAKVQRNGLTPG